MKRIISLAGLLAVVFTGLSPVRAADWEVTRRGGVRFVPVGIVVDSGAAALGAYQVTFTVKRGDVRIVGIEGGEHPAFRAAPYYDPKALQRQKVILAAFDTGRSLPRGRTRVATVHLEVRGKVAPRFDLRLDVAAGVDGERIAVETELEQRNTR